MTKKQPKRIERPGVDHLGRTPLHYAVLEERYPDATALLNDGAGPNARDDNGFTPLHFAAQLGGLEITKLLLSRGAEVDATDSYGNTPLSRAVFSSRGEGSLIIALRSAGADPLKVNSHGVSPLSLARTTANFDVRQFFSDFP